MNKPSVDSVASMKKQRVPLFSQDQVVWAGGGAAVVQGLGLACSQVLGKPALMPPSCRVWLGRKPHFLPNHQSQHSVLNTESRGRGQASAG